MPLSRFRWLSASLSAVAASAVCAQAPSMPQYPKAQPRPAGEGEGPFERLVIEAGLLIDGTGAPPTGPVFIVVEKNRITQIIYGEEATGAMAGPQARPGDKRIDARHGYVLPGLIDTHVRVIESYGRGNTSPEYPHKLLLAHGITTISSQVLMGSDMDWAMEIRRQSQANVITAPRTEVWVEFETPFFPSSTPEQAREWVREAKERGATGLGEGWLEGPPESMAAGIAEARKLGLPVIWHMNSRYTSRFNVLDAARAGMTGVSHWYGLTDALLKGYAQPAYPPDFNHDNSQSKFRQMGRLWRQVAPPHSERWNAVMNELLGRDFTLEPTFSVYEAHRDYMGVSNAEWNREYLHPVFEKDFVPGEGYSHFHNWTTADEIEWRNNFRLWMQFVNEYKNRGGRVIAGSDPAWGWANFGFAFVRNLEMLQEAGFTPLEVIGAATLRSAEAMQIQKEVGSIEVGKLADLVILDENPLENLKVLYGTGVPSVTPDGKPRRAGGVRYTVKDGIVFDAKRLLGDVRKMVSDARAADPARPRP
jgi:dihydroorotase-like cyclic amidohydrolase